MKTTQVWFGIFEFGDFEKCGEKFPCALIHRVDAKLLMDPDKADDYMLEQQYDAYLVPSQYEGEIYYSEVAK